MSRSARLIDDYVHVTLHSAINSPRNGSSTFVFINSVEPVNDREGFIIEREGDTMHITDRKTGKRVDFPWSTVKEAARAPLERCVKCKQFCREHVLVTSKGPTCGRECAALIEVPDPEETARP